MDQEIKSGLQAALGWYRSNCDAVSQYSGQWVAIGSAGVLAHGYDLEVVMAASERKGYARPLLYKVPPQGILAMWWSSDA